MRPVQEKGSHAVAQSLHDRVAQITEALHRRGVTGQYARNAAKMSRFAGVDEEAAVLFLWRPPVLCTRRMEGAPFSSPAILFFCATLQN